MYLENSSMARRIGVLVPLSFLIDSNLRKGVHLGSRIGLGSLVLGSIFFSSTSPEYILKFPMTLPSLYVSSQTLTNLANMVVFPDSVGPRIAYLHPALPSCRP